MHDTAASRLRTAGLGLSRAAAVARAAAAGYTFAPLAPGPARPHLVGRSADGRHRVGLIGPADRIFKAVLMADLDGEVTTAATWFLATFAPDWRDAPRWLAAWLPLVAAGGQADAALVRLQVRCSRMRNRPVVVLSLAWVPTAR
jgi:hypothetical protein